MDSVFKKHNVILAHCLTNLGGAGNPFSVGKDIYQRIDEVVNLKHAISCSTIKENDTIIHLQTENFAGPVGMILKNTIITFAHQGDAGTGVIEFGKRHNGFNSCKMPTESEIVDAILNRHPRQYNEFIASQYDVFGFFLCFDDEAYLLQTIENEKMFYDSTCKYNLPYFNLNHGILHKSKYDQKQNWFCHQEVFRTVNIYD